MASILDENDCGRDYNMILYSSWSLFFYTRWSIIQFVDLITDLSHSYDYTDTKESECTFLYLKFLYMWGGMNAKLYLELSGSLSSLRSKKNIVRFVLYHFTEIFIAMVLLHCAHFIDFNLTKNVFDCFGYFICISFFDQKVTKSMKLNYAQLTNIVTDYCSDSNESGIQMPWNYFISDSSDWRQMYVCIMGLSTCVCVLYRRGNRKNHIIWMIKLVKQIEASPRNVFFVVLPFYLFISSKKVNKSSYFARIEWKHTKIWLGKMTWSVYTTHAKRHNLIYRGHFCVHNDCFSQCVYNSYLGEIRYSTQKYTKHKQTTNMADWMKMETVNMRNTHSHRTMYMCLIFKVSEVAQVLWHKSGHRLPSCLPFACSCRYETASFSSRHQQQEQQQW